MARASPSKVSCAMHTKFSATVLVLEVVSDEAHAITPYISCKGLESMLLGTLTFLKRLLSTE